MFFSCGIYLLFSILHYTALHRIAILYCTYTTPQHCGAYPTTPARTKSHQTSRHITLILTPTMNTPTFIPPATISMWLPSPTLPLTLPSMSACAVLGCAVPVSSFIASLFHLGSPTTLLRYGHSNAEYLSPSFLLPHYLSPFHSSSLYTTVYTTYCIYDLLHRTLPLFFSIFFLFYPPVP